MKQAICFFLLLLMPAAAVAGSGAQTDLLPATLKLVGSMGIVLGIILVFYYLSRKGFNMLPGGKSGAIKVVEMRHLMPKKALCLVQVRGRELLLGIGVERIELIADLALLPTPTPAASFETNLHESLAATDQTTTASSSVRPAP